MATLKILHFMDGDTNKEAVVIVSDEHEIDADGDLTAFAPSNYDLEQVVEVDVIEGSEQMLPLGHFMIRSGL